jgi:hypothetical protein
MYHNYSPENWAQVEEFIKANFPNVPVYREEYYSSLLMVDKLGECYMMVYIFMRMEAGTAYHEVFAVWKMFTGPADKQTIIDEFRDRKELIDRFTGERIAYSVANKTNN